MNFDGNWIKFKRWWFWLLTEILMVDGNFEDLLKF